MKYRVLTPAQIEQLKKELAMSPYYLSYLDGEESKQTTVVRITDFSQKEFEDFKTARDTIESQLFQYMSLYNMVAIMYDNLVNAFDKRLEEVKAQKNISARDDLTELNAYFSALIANFGMYLDCVPKKISSKRSDILDVHNKATNEEFNRSFEYRLFCVLRNYTLHDSPPITGISGSSKMGAKPDEPEITYELYIEKSKLIKNRIVANKLSEDFAKH